MFTTLMRYVQLSHASPNLTAWSSMTGGLEVSRGVAAPETRRHGITHRQAVAGAARTAARPLAADAAGVAARLRKKNRDRARAGGGHVRAGRHRPARAASGRAVPLVSASVPPVRRAPLDLHDR